MVGYVQMEYNLPFAPKGKPLLLSKDTKSLNLLHTPLTLVITLSSAPPPAGKSSAMSAC